MLHGLNRFLLGTLKTRTNAHAVRGRPTLKDVERQFRTGSVRDLNETQMNSSESEMNANIESNTCRNTNALIRRCFIENYSEGDRDKEDDSTNNIDAILQPLQESGTTGKCKMKVNFNIMNTRYDVLKNVFKSLVHRMAYCKFNLCRDIEKNPGPHPIFLRKIVHAPHCYVLVFGSNAGLVSTRTILSLLYVIFLLTLSNQNFDSVDGKVPSRCSYCFQHSAIYIYKYRGKYLSRRIPHTSDGSFNPYVISNKEAHIIYGNINDDKITKCKTTTINKQPQQKTNERRHFMNYCLTHPGKFSCAVDAFLETCQP